MSTRYGQLAYTSFDAGTGRASGGWQVKQTIGDLDAEDTALLVSGVTTVLTPVEPMPDFPTPEQVSRLPHRLGYRPLGGRGVGYWHTAPAGVDGTGRPGNVFAHVVLDRHPAADRPIQRWRAPGWLCPYGPDQVSSAVLPADPPGLGTAVTKDSVIAFALDTSTWRLGTLLGLLDAVAAALDGGTPVVLGTQSVDSAAQWIGLVSFLMSPGTAQRLAFSTFDRVDQLAAGPPPGQHLTAVPVADLVLLPHGSLVIDETATLSLGEFRGEPHRTSAGQSIDVTAWSAMAQVALLDAGSARRVLDDVERYAARAGDDGLHAAWPMAMSVCEHDEFVDAREEANAVLVAHSPATVTDADVGRTVYGALDALVGTTTADAWNAVRTAPPGRAAHHADVTYVTRAAVDAQWLDQQGPIPMGPRRFGVPLPAEVAAVVGLALDQARPAGAARLLRVVDFLGRLGVTDPRLASAFDAQLATQLADRWQGPAVAHRLADASAPLRVAAAIAALPPSARTDGTVTLDPIVLQWLAHGQQAPRADELSEARPWDETWTRAALRGALAQQAGARDAADRFALLWWLRQCGATTFTELAESSAWDPYELMVAAGDVEALGGAVLPTLLTAPDSPALLDLATRVERSRTDTGARACARVRIFDVTTWLRDGNLEHQEYLTPLWEGAVSYVGAERVDVEFATRLVSIAAAASVHGLPFPASCATLATRETVSTAAVDRVVALVDAGQLNAADVVAAATLREDQDPSVEPDPVGDVVTVAAEKLAATREFEDSEQEAAAAHVLRLAGGSTTEPPDPALLRTHRKAVQRFLARHQDSSGSFASRMWGRR